MNSTHDGLSPNEPPTSVPGASLDETEVASTTMSSTSWNRALSNIDLGTLSPRSRVIKLTIGDEIVDGYTLTTLASELGRTSSWVSDRLNELRNEILFRANLFLPLTDAEYEALRDSIKENGIQVPVIIGEHTLIDGRHRWLIAHELGLKEIPARFELGHTTEEEHLLSFTINAARRHLNRKQKEDLVRFQLSSDWSRSSRIIGSVCGVSAPTVESVRARMRVEADHSPNSDEVEMAQEQIDAVFVPPPKDQDVRIGAGGKKQKAYAEGRGPKSVPDQTVVESRPIGYMACQACNQRHAVYKDGDGFRAEAI